MEKINKLKHYFRKEKIDGYIISKNDEFFGEYTPAHNDRLNFISNFSGSYGLALIIKEKNYLFVDGRYTIQANNQSGNYFKIITIPNKMPHDVLKNKKLTIGFDPKLFTNKSLNIFFNNSKCSFKPINKNLIDKIWKRKIVKNHKSQSSFSKLASMTTNTLGAAYLKYKNPPVSKDVVVFENQIDFSEPLILCEGVFDAMAIRRNAIALLGKNIPNKLKMRIVQHGVKEVSIVLDNDAFKNALYLSESLMNDNIKVRLVRMGSEDAADLGFKKVIERINSTDILDFGQLMQQKLCLN